MRLIDGDALFDAFDDEPWYEDGGRDMMAARELLVMAPTIEATPVAHGRWIQKKTAIGKTYSVCSHCGTDFKFQTDKGTLARLDMDGMNYCLSCGARMDKEGE